MNWLISPLLLILFAAPTLAAADSTATIYVWPLSAPSPTSFATVVLSNAQTPPTAEVKSFQLPSVPPSKDDLVRVGLYDPSTKQWTGTVTAASSFADGLRRKLTLHVDDNGDAYQAALSAYTLPGKSKTKDGKKGEKKDAKKKKDVKRDAENVLEVEVIPTKPGAQPILNKPVVLNAEGKVPQPEEKDERTFLQK